MDSDQPEPMTAAERRRHVLRTWKQANPDRVAAYRHKARTENREKWLEQRREESRRRHARQSAERERKERLNASQRRRYAENLDASRAYRRAAQARHLDRQRAADPEGFRERKNAAGRAWRAANRDELNRRARESYHEHPDRERAKRQRYFQAHQEEIRERRRAAYRRNPEAIKAANRRYKERERQRRAAGLPPCRRHTVPDAERAKNRAAADEFFSRPVTAERLERLRAELRTPDELLFDWARHSARARAAYELAHSPELAARVHDELERRTPLTAREREEARMDQIARGINARLRTQPRSASPQLRPPSTPRVGGHDGPL